MDIESFYRELSKLYEDYNLDKVKELLDDSYKQVNEEEDVINKLIVVNECYRFYRSAALNKEAFEFGNEILGIQDQVLPLYEGKVKGKEYQLLSIYSTLADLLAAKEEFDKACEIIKKSINVLALYKNTENQIAYGYTNLTVNYMRCNNLKAAEDNINKAMSIYEQMEGDKPEGYGIALSGLAEIYYMKKEYINAIATYKGALDELKKFYGESVIYANALENCAKICFDAGYGEDAQSLLEHANEIKCNSNI